ncbi:MAG: hypothetical protein EHM61_13395 [Acidobacteria bacterium]|nr:MAG: hypothetical protein EHM61_13395 [Acidobacteriota bacterium]
MNIPISYGYLLAATLAAGTIILFAIILRRQLAVRVAECPFPPDTHQVREHEFYTEFLMPLLVFERDYPSFIAILSLVVSRFPISRFTAHEEVRAALAFLREASFNGGNPKEISSVMCVIVNAFVNDPDVEYEFRLKLPDLLNKFLDEVSATATGWKVGTPG